MRGVSPILTKCCFVIWSAAYVQLEAQGWSKEYRYLAYYYSLHTMWYAGDIDAYNFPSTNGMAYIRPNIGFGMLYRYSPRTSFRGSYDIGQIAGDDRSLQRKPEKGTGEFFRYVRGANFTNIIMELKGEAVFDLFDNKTRFDKRIKWTPYGVVGIGYFYMNPRADYGFGRQSLRGYFDYSSHQVCIPMGGGARFRLSRNMDLSVEVNFRKTFTGYLDGVYGAYSDPSASSRTRIYQNPSMVGYYDDNNVQEAINENGITVYRINENQEIVEVTNLQSDEAGDLLGQNGFSLDASDTYITPTGYGMQGQKRAEFYHDWYYTVGIHLIYIISPKSKELNYLNPQ